MAEYKFGSFTFDNDIYKILDTEHGIKEAAKNGTEETFVSTGEKYQWNRIFADKPETLVGAAGGIVPLNSSSKIDISYIPALNSVIDVQSLLGIGTKIATITISDGTPIDLYSPNYMDPDAWVENSLTRGGYVPKGEGNSSKMWATDSSGNPAWRDYTSGTITKVESGDGLLGGPITSSGTLKVNLRSFTKLTNNSTAGSEVIGKIYPVALDAQGYLAVSVPWITYANKAAAEDGNEVSLVTTGDKYIWNNKVGTVTLCAGAENDITNATTTTGNTYLNLIVDGNHQAGVKLEPGLNISITSDDNGNVIIATVKTVEMTEVNLTLSSSGWSEKTQTATVTGVTSSNSVIVSAAPSSIEDYSKFMIRCTSQGTNSLTFNCEDTPDIDIVVNILILEEKTS